MPTVLVAGATGDLGRRVVRELLARGADVRVLTRPASSTADRLFGGTEGVVVTRASYGDPAALRDAVRGVDVVVSTVSGVRDVIVDAQTALLEAAVAEAFRPWWLAVAAVVLTALSIAGTFAFLRRASVR